MDSTVKSLKNLYVALGGDMDDVTNISRIPDMIEAVAVVADAFVSDVTSKSLPDVTTSSNGQILTVAEGTWTAANAPAELPTVTAANDGAVLTVVDGAWAAV